MSLANNEIETLRTEIRRLRATARRLEEEKRDLEERLAFLALPGPEVSLKCLR